MKKAQINSSQTYLTFVLLMVFFGSCNQDKTEDQLGENVASCEGCHTDYAYLQEVYSADTVAPAGGCGGEAPHYEPYDRVYMGGDGFEAYKESGHYEIGCVGCHNGTDLTVDKMVAHSGDFISHPSEQYQEKCGSCHASIVENFQTSLHNGTGQKRKVAMRSGLSGPEDFSQLPAHQIAGYNANCATCHGTCGNCHVVRPPIGGGGLAKGHDFTRTPDMVSTCVTCHVSRGGHAYLGVASGTQPDVHLTKLGYDCMDCHSGDELHGNGEVVEQRYAYSGLPECKECHYGLEVANSYHWQHYTDFNCQVCHSQDYNNCGSCHIHGEGARVPSYIDYKIALNPIPDVKDYEFALVRRTLAAPDNWKEYDVAEYENFDAFPTYNYTSPHNILKWTSRTQVEDGKRCYNNCHIRKEGDVLVNKVLYLFKENLLEWEVSATEKITVDGELPVFWTK
ncbi:MAG: hypothetical protein HQ541_23175 [Mariniphaga sp.]|nr:hypothetical protein [Mariniphaga sp.]